MKCSHLWGRAWHLLSTTWQHYATTQEWKGRRIFCWKCWGDLGQQNILVTEAGIWPGHRGFCSGKPYHYRKRYGIFNDHICLDFRFVTHPKDSMSRSTECSKTWAHYWLRGKSVTHWITSSAYWGTYVFLGGLSHENNNPSQTLQTAGITEQSLVALSLMQRNPAAEGTEEFQNKMKMIAFLKPLILNKCI